MSEYFVGTTGSNSQTTFESLSTSEVLDDLQLNTGDAPTFSGLFLNSTGTGANNTIFSVDGSNGRLFGVTDDVTGTIFSVNDAAGLPILEVESTSGYDKITIGEYGSDLLVLSGQTTAEVTGSQIATESWVNSLGFSADTNYYLTGIEKSSNTLSFKVSGASDVDYTFGSNAFTSTTIPAAANNATITISAGTNLAGGGDFTTDQSSNETITINHATISRSDTTSSESLSFGGTFEAIDSITSSNGHVTAENTMTYTLPTITSGDITGAFGADVVLYDSDGAIEATEFIGDVRGAISFKGQAGEAITKGQAVFISGISGNTTVVGLADANDATRMPAFGIAAETVGANNPVTVINFGELNSLDTATPNWYEGDELFVSTTAGALTTTAPTSESSLLQKIAKVVRRHASAGSITVMGAGRTNAVPNLNEGRLFVGNSSNQAVADGTIHVDIANSRVGIGTTSPAQKLHVSSGHILLDNNQQIRFKDSGATQRTIIQLDSSNDLAIGGSYAGALKFMGGGSYTEQMRIHDDGNVGIGTTSPSYKLDVAGNAARVGNSSQTTTSLFLTATNTAGAPARAVETVMEGYEGRGIGTFYKDTTYSGEQWFCGMNYSGNFDRWSVGYDQSGGQPEYLANTLFSVNQSGNVGIGTYSPNTLLHLSSSGPAVLTIEADTDNVTETDNAGIILKQDGGGVISRIGFVSGLNELEIINQAANSLYLGTNNATRLTVDSSGNVGIGTTSPAAKLDVNGAITNSNGNVRIESVSGQEVEIASTRDIRLLIDSNNDETTNRFEIQSNTSTSNDNNIVFVVEQDGKVGINNTSPQATLELKGSTADSSENAFVVRDSASAALFSIRNDGRIDATGNVVIGGTLTVNGTTTTINSTTISVDDKNIELGSVATPTDTTADGGGITLKGATDKTINWVNSTSSWTSNQTFSAPNLTLTSLSNQSSEATALVINGSNVVGYRELGSNAFNSTSYLPLSGGTMSGNLTIASTDPTITLFDNSGANTDPNGTIIFSEVSGTTNFDINYNGASDRLEFRGLISSTLTDLVYIKRNSTDTVEVFGNVTASSFIKSGGTSSQFLKADGSVDSNTYLTAHPTISAASSSDNSGRTYIQDILLDSNGHVTGITTATETVTDTNTTYSAGTHLSLSGTTFNVDFATANKVVNIGHNSTNNEGEIILDTSNGGSPQISFTDHGDATWAIGVDDEDNSFKIHGSASSTIPTINALGTPLFEITTGGIGYLGTNRLFADNYHPNADKLTAARTISLGGDLSGSASFDGSTNITITAAVADDSHNHIISNVDGLQTALDGKASSTHNHTLDSLSNVTITSNTSGEILRWSGAAWINSTLSEAGIQASSTALTTSTTFGGDVSGTYNAIVVANDSHTHNANNLTGTTLASGVTASSLTSVGTIGTGVWQGSVIASAYLDADTAHLSGTQTFTGAKTFNNITAANGYKAEINESSDADNITANLIKYGLLYNAATNKPVSGNSHYASVGNITLTHFDSSATDDFYIRAKAYNGNTSWAKIFTNQNSDGITTVGTITSGEWNGSVISSAYLDADTAHLSTTQTFSGQKTFDAANTYINNDLTVYGGVYVSSNIYHAGDTDTRINFNTNSIKIEANSESQLLIDAAGIVVNELGNDNDFRIEGSGEANALFVQGSNGFVGIHTNSPQYELHVIGTASFTDTVAGAYFEENASHPSLKKMDTGTILVMNEDGDLVPCSKADDTMVFGVSKHGYKQPIVMGAEPIKVTGPIKVGDFITTSEKEGHGKKSNQPYPFGTIIAQAMESGDGESHTIKAMIRKM